MAHGRPDYGATASKTTVHGISDMGEIPPRLGSIVTYDRRGDVIYLEDFEGPVLKFTKWSASDDGTVLPSISYARSGVQSLKLLTDSGDGKWVAFWRPFPLTVASNTGMEISFTAPASKCTLSFFLYIFDGSQYQVMGAYYENTTYTTKLLVPGSPDPTIITQQLSIQTGLFHTIKIVGDYSSGYYSRLLLDDMEEDISAHQLTYTTSTSAPYCYAFFRIANDAGPASEGWFDDFILTQGET